MPRGNRAPALTDPADLALWESLEAHQGEPFTTSGRGSTPGKPFTYTIRGAELFVDRRAKSITRATVLTAWRRVCERERAGLPINGPKSIGVHGDSYLFAIFAALGLIHREGKET